jgi:GT2 family glycosyltransferase
MSSKPELSVIVANYNNEQYIRHCLDSILNQTYKDHEILKWKPPDPYLFSRIVNKTEKNWQEHISF